MKKTITAILVLVLSLGMMCACGQSGGDAEEGSSDVMDLSAGITRTDDSATGEATVESDIFTLTLPDGDKWGYEVESPESIVFYNTTARDADFGGTLFTLSILEEDDQTDEIMPSAVLAELEDGRRIAAIFTSDVQYDFNDEAAAAEYMALYEVVHTISDDASTSPLVLK